MHGPLSAYVFHFGVSSECQLLASCHRKQVAPPKGLAQSEFMEYVKFRALEPVSIISPLSELRIVQCLFCWIPYLPRKYLLKFHNVCQPFD